jgi:hypothetical protein
MDDDPVLRELGAELERDDPALAALLSGAARPHHRHWMVWGLLAVTVVAVGVVLVPTVTLGVLAMLLVLASPLLACWWCALPDDGTAPRPT